MAALQDLGVEAVDVGFDTLQYAELLQITGPVDGFVTHERMLTEHREDYSPDLARRYLAGQVVLARDYVKSMKVQRLVKEEFAKVLRQVDFLAAPTIIATAFPIGADTVTIGGVAYSVKSPGITVTARNTFLANTTGLPALTVPCGLSESGLPMALQLIGRPFDEALLFRVASRYEELSPMAGRLPSVVD